MENVGRMDSEAQVCKNCRKRQCDLDEYVCIDSKSPHYDEVVEDETCERFRAKNKKTKKGDYRGVCKSR